MQKTRRKIPWCPWLTQNHFGIVTYIQAFDLHEPVLSQAATHNPSLHPKTNPAYTSTSTANPQSHRKPTYHRSRRSPESTVTLPQPPQSSEKQDRWRTKKMERRRGREGLQNKECRRKWKWKCRRECQKKCDFYFKIVTGHIEFGWKHL